VPGPVSSWNYADVWEAIADVRPDDLAQVQGTRRYTWAEWNRRADGVATTLLQLGLGQQAKVAQYLYNSPEYLESIFAAWKAALVPVNTNYRYGDDEVAYLWDNGDVEAVVFHGAFVDRIERVRPRLPAVRGWLWVDDGTGACPSWAVPYEEAAAGGATGGRTAGPWGRSPDDLFLLYTGGTTGMPKGVMWRQDDLFVLFNRTARLRYPETGDLSDVRTQVAALERRPVTLIPCPPLMHGSGTFTSFTALASAGCIVLLESRSFSAVELLDTIERERATEIAIVGDAFAKPILRELDANPRRWDLSSLWLMISSGVMWAAETKEGLVRHVPKLLCVDTLGSSESVGMASSRSSQKETAGTAGFVLSPDARVVSDDGVDVVAGSGEIGRVALRGRMSLGYYKDDEKTARAFHIIDGQRWSIPGDYATVEADGSVKLLGRGSVCINTGGEKVFPEEVEEVVKLHPAVADAVVVGLPDERFGEMVVAVVEPVGVTAPDPAELIAHVKARLAHYKAPRRVVVVASIGRAASGKVEYQRLKAAAADALGISLA
jgi:acyl-CoA synthetase (AMP-forming)/AMP-acid ligase II